VFLTAGESGQEVLRVTGPVPVLTCRHLRAAQLGDPVDALQAVGAHPLDRVTDELLVGGARHGH